MKKEKNPATGFEIWTLEENKERLITVIYSFGSGTTINRGNENTFILFFSFPLVRRWLLHK